MCRLQVLTTLIGTALVYQGPVLAQEKRDARTEILAGRAAWNKAVAERKIEVLADLITPDFSLTSAVSRSSGQARHIATFASIIRNRPDLFYERKPIRVEALEGEDYAYEIGTWVERWTQSGEPTELQGDYFVLWHRFGTKWKQQSEIFAPSRCIGRSYCVPSESPAISPLKSDLVRRYTGWYQLSKGPILEIQSEGNFLIAHCPSLFREAMLIPKSDTEFGLGPLTLRFVSGNSASASVSVELVRNGQIFHQGKKLDANP
jgi:ketosteroid isomerase-like protein